MIELSLSLEIVQIRNTIYIIVKLCSLKDPASSKIIQIWDKVGAFDTKESLVTVSGG